MVPIVLGFVIQIQAQKLMEVVAFLQKVKKMHQNSKTP